MVRALLSCTLACVWLAGCQIGNETPNAANSANVVQIAQNARQVKIALAGPTVDGKQYSVPDLGQLVVINVWASWCRTCQIEWDDLQSLARNNSDVTFVGLNTSDDRASALNFIEQRSSSYPHIFDPNNVLYRSMDGVPSLSIPTTLVLDRQHRLAAHILGRINADQMQSLLDGLASE